MNNLPDTTSPFEIVPATTQAAAPSPWEQHGHHMREWFELFQGSWKAAEVLAATDFVPDAWKGKPHSVAAAMMKGYEMGITPIDALANMHVIKGKIGFAAEYMRRRIIESGHEYVIEESTETRCRIRARRKGGEEWQQFTFTADQAKKARIDLGSYPADKLVARASSRMCRYMFPEVLNGFALSEDLEDLDEPLAPPVQATAQRSPARKTARRSAPSRAVESAKSQTPAPAEEGSGQAVSAGMPPLPGDEDTPSAAESGTGEEAPAPASKGSGSGGSEAADVSGGVEMCTRSQQQKLAILLKEEGFNERAEKLEYLEKNFGRPFTSSAELTKVEASQFIDFLENAQAGEQS